MRERPRSLRNLTTNTAEAGFTGSNGHSNNKIKFS